MAQYFEYQLNTTACYGNFMTAKYIKRVTNPNNLNAPLIATSAEVLLSGKGETKTQISFNHSQSSIVSGIWESDAFSKKKAHPNEMEFCYLIEGLVKLTDLDGNYSEFSAGEAFIVEPGFDGIWESKVPVRKYFVLAKCAS
jgi:uncharacterized cupin superfamily protein